MAQITTSLVVQFGAGVSAGLLSLEMAPEMSGVTLVPGDAALIHLYKTSNVILDPLLNSAGVLTQVGSGLRTITEDLNFINTNSANLSHPLSGGLTLEWLGNSLGNTIVTEEHVVTSNLSGVAVGRVTYQTPYLLYSLQSPAIIGAHTKFPIIVYASGTTP